ncbi:hypothetical protein LTR27_011775 [Elasticomyces elasticus]|nr:hypothetical protein LTR27_011775 [Elasticomyces elasticus]
MTVTNGAAANGESQTPSFAANLSGKTAIVTGSSRGIGAGIALELGRRGANVVVNYTSAKSLAVAVKVVEQIRNGPAGASAVVVQGDVALASDRKRLVDAALELSPEKRIDMLVHNAGNGDDRYLVDLDEEFYDMQMSLNLKGTPSALIGCATY